MTGHIQEAWNKTKKTDIQNHDKKQSNSYGTFCVLEEENSEKEKVEVAYTIYSKRVTNIPKVGPSHIGLTVDGGVAGGRKYDYYEPRSIWDLVKR